MSDDLSQPLHQEPEVLYITKDALDELRARIATLEAREAVLAGVRDRIENERGMVSGIDGYNYASGEEYGLRKAVIMLDEALATLDARAKALLEVLKQCDGLVECYDKQAALSQLHSWVVGLVFKHKDFRELDQGGGDDRS